ncbi:MAG: WbuC family cupin fold metalloprotein [Bryobacteraceae bacterium]|nr:WbuC family cupin fold metalloprotein [Bryobacteraceae bacterium]
MIQLVTPELIASLVERARQSPRRRVNHNFHAGPADNPHRFLNVLLRGTYVRPHRHVTPPKSEGFVLLEGSARVVLFDDAGEITAAHPLAAHSPGVSPLIDLPPGVWHTVIATSDVAVCYEVKPGPWEPASDKDFARWAPPEGDPSAATYLERLTLASPPAGPR